MSEAIVAYRYAKSLIELANEKNVVDDVYKDMGLFKQVCDENKQFLVVMGSPIVRGNKKMTILKKVFEKNVRDLN